MKKDRLFYDLSFLCQININVYLAYYFIGGDIMHIKIKPPKSKQIFESELLKILSRKPIKRR